MKRENVKLARSLRKRTTDQERMVWARLKGLKALGFHFRRQHPIGRYVVDFVCLSSMLVVEIDGSQHYSESGKRADDERDRTLGGMGFRIMRFTNADVNVAPDQVVEAIGEELKRLKPAVYEAGPRALEGQAAIQRARFEDRHAAASPPPEIANRDFGLPQGGGKR